MLTHTDVADVLGPQGLANIIWALAALKCISSTNAPVAEASVQTGGVGWGGVGGAAAGMALGEERREEIGESREAGGGEGGQPLQPLPPMQPMQLVQPLQPLQGRGTGRFVILRELEAAVMKRVRAVCAQGGFRGMEVTIILWSLATLGAIVERDMLAMLEAGHTTSSMRTHTHSTSSTRTHTYSLQVAV